MRQTKEILSALRLMKNSEMLDILYKELKNNEVSKIFLEVRRSNEAAINLYKSEGFEETGIRKGFYEKPREDAILFMKNI